MQKAVPTPSSTHETQGIRFAQRAETTLQVPPPPNQMNQQHTHKRTQTVYSCVPKELSRAPPSALLRGWCFCGDSSTQYLLPRKSSEYLVSTTHTHKHANTHAHIGEALTEKSATPTPTMTMLRGRLDAATKQSIVCKAAKKQKQDAKRKGGGGGIITPLKKKYRPPARRAGEGRQPGAEDTCYIA